MRIQTVENLPTYHELQTESEASSTRIRIVFSYKSRPCVHTSLNPLNHPSPSIDLFTVFSTFDMDKFGKSVDTTGKSALMLLKLPNLKVIRLKRAKIQVRKVAKIYRRWYGGGQVCVFHHTNVCKISRLRGAISSLIFNKSLSNLAILLILKSFFQWCRRFVPNLSVSKVEKKKNLKRSIRIKKYQV